MADSLFRADAFRVPGWEPVALEKLPGVDLDPEDCEYVMPFDVYRLADGVADSVVAGCHGYFDADSSRDYALLLRNQSTGNVRPFVFLKRTDGFRPFQLGPVSDHYGFDEDPSSPPGPFRSSKPEFFYASSDDSLEASELPDHDYIQVGWQTYFWNGREFIALWTSD